MNYPQLGPFTELVTKYLQIILDKFSMNPLNILPDTASVFAKNQHIHNNYGCKNTEDTEWRFLVLGCHIQLDVGELMTDN